MIFINIIAIIVTVNNYDEKKTFLIYVYVHMRMCVEKIHLAISFIVLICLISFIKYFVEILALFYQTFARYLDV